MVLRRCLAWLAVAILALGCGEPPEGIRTLVVDYPAPGGGLGLVERELFTVEDLETLAGTTARFTRGGRVIIDLEDMTDLTARSSANGTEPTPEELAALVLEDLGEPVSLSWLEDGDLVVPQDYDTLSMLTIYYHLERFDGWLRDHDGDLPGPLRVLYHPTMVDETTTGLHVPILDDMGYVRFVEVIVVLPCPDAERAPLPVNPGVVAHEAAHWLFDDLVLRHHLPRFEVDQARAAALLNAFDEGTADFLAAAYTQDPRFLGKSIPALAYVRDVSQHHVFTAHMAEAAGEPGYDPYALGSVWASTLWAIAELTSIDWTVKTLLTTLSASVARLPWFDELTLPQAFAAHSGPMEALVCDIVMDHFQAAAWPQDGPCAEGGT